MRFLPVNLNAFLVELDNLDQTLALLASLHGEPLAGIVEVVPAARTLLVRFQPDLRDVGSLIDAIARRDVSAVAVRGDALVEIPVCYDGDDLDEVARMLGITRQEVVDRHTGGEYTVAFTGFAPGFGYLAGGDPTLDVPRRSTPRTRIPAGAVGLAGSFSGVYPQSSPGGWQIIGTTPLAMWDIGRNPPALLQPGTRVRFIAIDAAAVAATGSGEGTRPTTRREHAAPEAATAVAAGPALEVLGTGLQTLFQDQGRHGQAKQGISASGAMDKAACRAANRLAGNPTDAACIETCGGGLRLRSRGDTVVAVTGAQAPLTVTTATGSCWPVSRHEPFALADGDVLSVGEPAAGTRSYVAARGGFMIQAVLGSCATDTLARVGPPAIAVGDMLAVRPARGAAVVAAADTPPESMPAAGAEVVLDVVPGPRTDWFVPEALALLRRQPWRVTPQSDRVGIRLSGEVPLARAKTCELPSEGTVAGAIQIPASGQPVLFLADHPLTGGYPVIACVAPYHLDRAGQIPVGAWVRFNPIRAFEPVIRDASHASASTPTAGQAS